MSSPNFIQNAVTRRRETCSDLLQYARANRDEGTFNDVILQVDNLSIGANRMVLACYSTFFEKMFKSKMKEQYERNIPVTGVDSKTVNTLVDFMYNGQVTIDNNSVINILAGADYFQIDEVKTFCFEYLMDQITCGNWNDVLVAAKLYRSNELLKQVSEFVTNHFDKIIQTTDFKNFTKDDLISIVSSNLNRSKVNELSVYQAIVNWIKHNEDERKREFVELFQLMKLNRLSYGVLQDILSENLVQQNFTCVKSVWSLLFKFIEEKAMKENESKILMIGGGVNCDKVSEIFNCYNIEPNYYPDLPYGVEDHSLLKLNDVVFCIGGCDPSDNTNNYSKVCQMKLNESNLRWSEVVAINEKRSLMGAAVFRDHLVVAGGTSGVACLATAEYYNHSLDGWQMAPTMQQKRSNNSLVVCGNYLFALGGFDEKEYLSSVERLHSLNRDWEFMTPMLMRRSAVAAVSLNGLIYAIGGRSGKDNNSRQKTVERYDPKLNEWNYVCEMNYVRSGACACVFHGRIFVAGGFDVEGKLVKNMECYNPLENSWKIVESSRNESIVPYSAAIVI